MSSPLNEVLRQVGGLLRTIASEADSKPPAHQPSAFVFFSRGGHGAMSLTDEHARAYHTALELLCAWAGKHRSKQLGRKALESWLQVALLDAADVRNVHPEQPKETRVLAALGELSDRLKSPARPWNVHLPVFGVTSGPRALQIGAVRFQDASPRVVGRLKTAGRAILATTADPPDRRKMSIAQYREWVAAHFQGATVATVTVRAMDKDAAQDLAAEELERAVDSVNFFVDMLTPPSVFKGASTSPASPLPPVTFDGKQSLSYSPFPPVRHRFDLHLLHSARARVIRYPAVARLLLSASRSDDDDRLLTALQLCGRAATVERSNERFLIYLIALETLLLGPDQEGEITYRLRLYTAHLLGKTAADRARMFKRVGELYGVRSKIVHAGRRDVTDDDLSAVRLYAKAVVVALLRRRARSPKPANLDAWLKDRVLTAGCKTK